MNSTTYYGLPIANENLPPALQKQIRWTGIKNGVCPKHGKAHVFPSNWLTKKPYCTACQMNKPKAESTRNTL